MEELFASFREFLSVRMAERSINVRRLAEATGISIKHLEALLADDSNALPPGPYVRGYVVKLGKMLDFNGDEWWEKMEYSRKTNTSGESDRLPQNRFAKKNIPIKFVIAGICVLVFGVYAVIRVFLSVPDIKIQNPEEAVWGTTEDFVEFSGHVSSGSKLSLNGEPVSVSEEGNFIRKVALQSGINAFEFRAKKGFGGERVELRQVIYTPLPVPLTGAGGESNEATSTKSTSPKE